MVQTGLKKGGHNFSYESTPHCEKESSVHERKMHLIEFKICVVAGNGSHVVVTHQIFRFCTAFLPSGSKYADNALFDFPISSLFFINLLFINDAQFLSEDSLKPNL